MVTSRDCKSGPMVLCFALFCAFVPALLSKDASVLRRDALIISIWPGFPSCCHLITAFT